MVFFTGKNDSSTRGLHTRTVPDPTRPVRHLPVPDPYPRVRVDPHTSNGFTWNWWVKIYNKRTLLAHAMLTPSPMHAKIDDNVLWCSWWALWGYLPFTDYRTICRLL